MNTPTISTTYGTSYEKSEFRLWTMCCSVICVSTLSSKHRSEIGYIDDTAIGVST